jgi:phosphopantothenoylcysteine synthetase/decarboxylase
MNIILAGTGSVAAIKYWRLFKALQDVGTVKGILTDKGAYFASTALAENKDLLHIASSGEVYSDSNEWSWKKIGDTVLHIDLKDWADVLVIAPLSANTLTKMAVGICDNLLTSLYYAWPKDKNIVVAPAMNTDMWNNPLTDKHLKELRTRHSFSRLAKKDEELSGPQKSYESIDYQPITIGNSVREKPVIFTQRLCIVEPVESKLACGVLGKGAMAPLADIVNAVKEYGE